MTVTAMLIALMVMMVIQDMRSSSLQASVETGQDKVLDISRKLRALKGLCCLLLQGLARQAFACMVSS